MQEIRDNFKKVKCISRADARKKRVRSEAHKRLRFFTEYNPRGPNVLELIKKHEHFIRGHEFLNRLFPPGCFQVVHRRSKNLKELILRADPYSVKNPQHGCYTKCGRCDSCKNFVFGYNKVKIFATGRVINLRKDIDCNTPNVVYCAECLKCGEQGVGSTWVWKPRLSNYKSHIRHNRKTCRIVKHFTDKCKDLSDPHKYLKFHILDCLDNVEDLSPEEIDHLLLEKEKFWIKTLVTVHKGMNSHHDLHRKNRNEQENFY